MNIVITSMPTTNLLFIIEYIEEHDTFKYEPNDPKIRGEVFESARLFYRLYGPRAKQYVIDFCEYILTTDRCEEYFDGLVLEDGFILPEAPDQYEFIYSFFVSVVGRAPNLTRDFSNIQFKPHQSAHTQGSIFLSL